MKKLIHQPHENARMHELRAVADQINMPEDSLRKLNHVDWLNDFARMLDLHTRVERTPTRVGTINRLRLAAGFIALLQRDAKQLKLKLDDQGKEIADLKAQLNECSFPHDGRD